MFIFALTSAPGFNNIWLAASRECGQFRVGYLLMTKRECWPPFCAVRGPRFHFQRSFALCEPYVRVALFRCEVIKWRAQGRAGLRCPPMRVIPNFSATRAWIGTASIHRCSAKRTRDVCLPASAQSGPPEFEVVSRLSNDSRASGHRVVGPIFGWLPVPPAFSSRWAPRNSLSGRSILACQSSAYCSSEDSLVRSTTSSKRQMKNGR
jgi:hypothetical protein